MSIGPRSFNASTVMPNFSSNWQWANYELQNCTSSTDLDNNWETISGLSSEMDMDFRPPISSLAMEDISFWAPSCVPNLSTEYEKMFEEAASRSRFVESNTILLENYQKLFDPAMIKQEIDRPGSNVWDKSNESCSFTQLLTGHNANRLAPVLPSDSCNQAERLSDQSSVTHSGDQSEESTNPQACNKNLVEDGSNYSPDQKRFLSSSGSEAKFKRPKTEQNGCFPLKVRKEKLGERISALQQLVSPFGKTDTASVLLESIGYIKFLHEQVQVLSTPYMKGSSTRSRNNDSAKGGWLRDKDDPSLRADLRSRGLCLVPVTNSLQIANDNGADYWAPAVTSLQ